MFDVMTDQITFLQGNCLDVLKTIESDSVNCCVTSPPYWGLRDYGVNGQLGLEKTPAEYVASMVNVFREVRRVLKPDGTLWLNLGDSYCGGGNNRCNSSPISKLQAGNKGATGQVAAHGLHKFKSDDIKRKDLIGIPWRVAFGLQADGWFLRQDIIWHKPNPMPESVRDRCTKAHEYIFMLAKSEKYFFDSEANREGSAVYTRKATKSTKIPDDNGKNSYMTDSETRGFGRDITTIGRNRRSVWTVTTKPFKGAHFATFPPDLVEPCIAAGCPKDGVVLDPFFGAGTTGLVALNLGRRCIGVELNQQYLDIAKRRIFG